MEYFSPRGLQSLTFPKMNTIDRKAIPCHPQSVKKSKFLSVVLTAPAALFFAAMALPLGLAHGQSKTLELDMSNPKLWTVDVVHLGSKQIDITYDAKDNAVVMLPT